MDGFLPQEIEVRYIIPAIRGQLAKVLIKEEGVSQKEAAKILGLTEAAISQYVHDKRGNEVMFSEQIVDEVRKTAKLVIEKPEDKQLLTSEMYRLSQMTSVKQVICDIHRKQSKDYDDCDICFQEEPLNVDIK